MALGLLVRYVFNFMCLYQYLVDSLRTLNRDVSVDVRLATVFRAVVFIVHKNRASFPKLLLVSIPVCCTPHICFHSYFFIVNWYLVYNYLCTHTRRLCPLLGGSPCEWHRVTRMTGPDCATVSNLIHINACTTMTINSLESLILTLWGSAVRILPFPASTISY